MSHLQNDNSLIQHQDYDSMWQKVCTLKLQSALNYYPNPNQKRVMKKDQAQERRREKEGENKIVIELRGPVVSSSTTTVKPTNNSTEKPVDTGDGFEEIKPEIELPPLSLVDMKDASECQCAVNGWMCCVSSHSEDGERPLDKTRGFATQLSHPGAQYSKPGYF